MLEIVVTQVDPRDNLERLVQLVNKTNQFNVTTKRYEMTGMQNIVEDMTKKVYLYNVKDKFGDNGIVGTVIIDCSNQNPFIEEFVLSCRVMGKNIEYTIMQMVETQLRAEGHHTIDAKYIPTTKNKPVAFLYDNLEYTMIQQDEDGTKTYRKEMR